MDWRVVYDIDGRYAEYVLEPTYLGLIFVAISIVLVVLSVGMNVDLPVHGPIPHGRGQKIFCVLFLITNLAWTSNSFLKAHNTYSTLMSAYTAATYEVVEGEIKELEKATAREGGFFVVQGVRFEYTVSPSYAGYTLFELNEDPLRKGRNLQIWHVNKRIIRLAIEN